MINVTAVKGAKRYDFVASILGLPHMTVFKDGKEIALWYVTEDDKAVLDEMEKETK